MPSQSISSVQICRVKDRLVKKLWVSLSGDLIIMFISVRDIGEVWFRDRV